jgi:glycerophosphoryl diester phosphodiesterase
VLREAQRRGNEVHVSAVNDATKMVRMIIRGVDHIITDDPDLLIQVRSDWQKLTGTERLVLASPLLLGLEP